MAGIFGLFDFTKEGLGINKNTPPLKGLPLFFSIYFNNFWKLVQLNLLFLLFSLPIVTLPAAVCALTRVLRDIVGEKPIFIWSDFWSAFRSNFVQSFFYGIIVAFAAFLVYVNAIYYIHNAQSNLLVFIGELIVLTLTILFILMSFYIPLMIVSVKLKLSVIFNNAFRLSIIAFFRNLITFFLVLFFGIASVLIFPLSAFLFVFILFSTIGFIICFNSFPILKKYVIKETKSDSIDNVQPIFKD